MSKRCSAQNRNGKRCGAWTVTSETKCALHLDPDRASKLGSKRRRRGAHQPDSESVPIEPPQTAADVRDVLSSAMAQVHSRKMDTKTASTLAYLATSLLRAIEVSDFENRLDALEDYQRGEARALVRLRAPESDEEKEV
jgi:hypothetical protein